MRRDHTRRLKPLPGCGIRHPIGDERGKALLVKVLELATPASAEMATRRLCVMWSRRHRALRVDQIAWRGAGHVPAAGGQAVALGGNADDRFRLAHNAAA